ncbi:DUF6114 domain-containing protein [Nocardioides sp. Kera G14]|uniref:DUF6114 domain-containing protein n=1 Tax=Nocardioides sp. Kera G14 TaxID=2884264 RepID=UPI001D10E1A2|nr:DUF6114 domain-containing protein [Nocardioides sp. Kera G14]UDY23199.1 DUF6114 domain-containing protein [Nocardioides sp. Kera G14]
MTDMLHSVESSAATPAKKSFTSRAWARFAHFRRTRPFWGAILLAWGAYMIGNPVFGSSFAAYANVGVRSIVPVLITIGLLAAAGVAMFLPSQRHFPAIMATALAVAALPLANLGGLIIGTVVSIIGAGMVFAWAPFSPKQLAKFADRDARKAQRKAVKAALRDGGQRRAVA